MNPYEIFFNAIVGIVIVMLGRVAVRPLNSKREIYIVGMIIGGVLAAWMIVRFS